MAKKVINLTISKRSIKKAIKQIEKIQKNLILAKDEFAKTSLEWIRDRANQYLDQRVKNFPNTANVSQYWELTKKSENIWELRNSNPYGAYIEFGTGIVGANKPHKVANSVKYKYDVNKHQESGWTWYNEELDLTMYGFKGYEGKSFLYDAFFDYFYLKEYVRIYELVMEKYLK